MKTITNLLLKSRIGIEKIFHVAIIFKLLEDILSAFSRIQVEEFPECDRFPAKISQKGASLMPLQDKNGHSGIYYSEKQKLLHSGFQRSISQTDGL